MYAMRAVIRACVRIRVYERAYTRVHSSARTRAYIYIYARVERRDKHSIIRMVGNLAWASFQTVSFAIVTNNGFLLSVIA